MTGAGGGVLRIERVDMPTVFPSGGALVIDAGTIVRAEARELRRFQQVLHEWSPQWQEQRQSFRWGAEGDEGPLSGVVLPVNPRGRPSESYLEVRVGGVPSYVLEIVHADEAR